LNLSVKRLRAAHASFVREPRGATTDDSYDGSDSCRIDKHKNDERVVANRPRQQSMGEKPKFVPVSPEKSVQR